MHSRKEPYQRRRLKKYGLQLQIFQKATLGPTGKLDLRNPAPPKQLRLSNRSMETQELRYCWHYKIKSSNSKKRKTKFKM